MTLIVKVRPIVSITELDGELISTQGDAYQWLLNGDTISGETNQSTAPIENGVFTVVMTAFNGCSNSDNFTLQNVSIDDEINIGINIYPNPSKGVFNIISDLKMNYIIYDLLGKEVLIGNSYSRNQKIDLSIQEDGIYIMIFKSLTGDLLTKRLIKN